MVSIDKRLNLVVPIDRDDGTILYVHSTPLPRPVFERYVRVIAKTFAEIVTGGYSAAAGPRIAALLLNLYFNGAKGGAEEAVAAAKQADTH